MDVYNLKQSCEQAEEALSQGMDKLQQTLAETVGTDRLGEGIYTSEMANNAIEKLEALVSFVNQVIQSYIIQFPSHYIVGGKVSTSLLPQWLPVYLVIGQSSPIGIGFGHVNRVIFG